jgi:peroxiredoxin
VTARQWKHTAFTTSRGAKRAYVIIDKEGVVRYLNVRPSNSEKDLLSTEELLNEVKKVNRGS